MTHMRSFNIRLIGVRKNVKRLSDRSIKVAKVMSYIPGSCLQTYRPLRPSVPLCDKEMVDVRKQK